MVTVLPAPPLQTQLWSLSRFQRAYGTNMGPGSLPPEDLFQNVPELGEKGFVSPQRPSQFCF